MLPVKSVLSRGRTTVMIPVDRIITKFQVRSKTALIWNRKLSSKDFIPQKQRNNEFNNEFIRSNSNSAIKIQKSITKWAILTGATLILGGLLLRVQNEKRIAEKEEVEYEPRKKSQRIRIFDNNWLFFCYSTLPLNAISRLWGQVNSLTLPVCLRPWGYKCYSYFFGVKLDEMIDPELTHYANLSEFFYREIKPETRPIASGVGVIVCPSDGKILHLGIIDSERGEIEQVKGLTYSLKDFLGTHSHPGISRSSSSIDLSSEKEKHLQFAKSNNFQIKGPNDDDEHLITIRNEGNKAIERPFPAANKIVKLLSELSRSRRPLRKTLEEPLDTELYYAVIYLAPGDYHRFHSPVDWICQIRRHFPGALFSVAPYFQHNFPNLFVLNERVATLGYWTHGFFSMTAVGATNVGSIRLNFDADLITNLKRHKHADSCTCYEATYNNASMILGGMPLIKGDEMGGFRLGSTVVLCFEAPKDFTFSIKPGDQVKMGQKLGALGRNEQ